VTEESSFNWKISLDGNRHLRVSRMCGLAMIEAEDFIELIVLVPY
jgi:hypothetical protein